MGHVPLVIKSERALERLSRRCGAMATNYRRTIVRDGSPAHRMARLETARYAITHRPSLVMVADNGWVDRRQPAQRRTTQGDGRSVDGAGQTDRGLAARSGPGCWDRFIQRVTRRGTVSPSVRTADATLTASLDRYNRVREYQGREPLKRTDLGLDEITDELTRTR